MIKDEILSERFQNEWMLEYSDRVKSCMDHYAEERLEPLKQQLEETKTELENARNIFTQKVNDLLSQKGMLSKQLEEKDKHAENLIIELREVRKWKEHWHDLSQEFAEALTTIKTACYIVGDQPTITELCERVLTKYNQQK